ncbi:MAG TPA: hypothetical protein VKU01_26205 [Bryobacteraceae bacterium]|nr:hypothetical protein [Bryobacteraceae bacterium]
MNKTFFSAATAIVAVLVLTACSEAPTTPAPTTEAAKPAAPTGPVPALTAFYEMYKPARTWATDIQPLSMASMETDTMKGEDGKYPVWSVVFVSPSKREARTFTYAVVAQGTDIHKGVSAGGAQVWSGATAKSAPFANSDIATNSDAAYQTAMERAGAWVKHNPGKAPQFSLAEESKYGVPVWYIMWGNKSNGYLVLVNATTGTVIGK